MALPAPTGLGAVGRNVFRSSVWHEHLSRRGFGTGTGPNTVLTGVRAGFFALASLTPARAGSPTLRWRSRPPWATVIEIKQIEFSGLKP